MAAAPALSLAWAGSPALRKPPKENERANFLILAVVVIAAAIFMGVVWRRPLPHMGWTPISPEAAQAIESCAGPMYNTYGDGGVLIWFARAKPVFIDNRQDPYPTDLLRANKTLETTGAYEQVFDDYRINCAALPPQSPVVARLESDARWFVSHRDGQWVVFGRRP
jgi:hypothetical protein